MNDALKPLVIVEIKFRQAPGFAAPLRSRVARLLKAARRCYGLLTVSQREIRLLPESQVERAG